MCCFCSNTLNMDDADAFVLNVNKPGSDASQSWFAHRACLSRAVHPRAQFEPDIHDD